FVAEVTITDTGHVTPALPPEAPATTAVREIGRERSAVRITAAIAVLVAVVLFVGWKAGASRAGNPTAALHIAPLTASGDVIDAIISPDAKYLAFVRSSAGRQSLWIRQLRGTNPIELVAPAAVSYFGMSFAPDSGSIYYVVRGPEPLASPAGMLFNIATLG